MPQDLPRGAASIRAIWHRARPPVCLSPLTAPKPDVSATEAAT